MVVFVLDRGEHAECAVAALAVVEDLEVLEDRVGQFLQPRLVRTVEASELAAKAGYSRVVDVDVGCARTRGLCARDILD